MQPRDLTLRCSWQERGITGKILWTGQNGINAIIPCILTHSGMGFSCWISWVLPPHIPTTSTELLALIRGHPYRLEYHPRFVHLPILTGFPMISEFLVSLGQRMLLQGKQIPVVFLNHCSWLFLFYIPVLTCAPHSEYFLGIWRQ